MRYSSCSTKWLTWLMSAVDAHRAAQRSLGTSWFEPPAGCMRSKFLELHCYSKIYHESKPYT